MPDPETELPIPDLESELQMPELERELQMPELERELQMPYLESDLQMPELEYAGDEYDQQGHYHREPVTYLANQYSRMCFVYILLPQFVQKAAENITV